MYVNHLPHQHFNHFSWEEWQTASLETARTVSCATRSTTQIHGNWAFHPFMFLTKVLHPISSYKTIICPGIFFASYVE